MRQLALLSLLLAAPLGDAVAQEIAPTKPTPKREGFYIGFGVGTGHLSFGGDVSDAEGQSALSGHFRLGGTLNQQWRLGAETNGWVKSMTGVDMQYAALLGTATFYPSPTGNFFLKGGLGFGAYVEDYGTDDFRISGGALTLGIGYDFRFSGNVVVSLVGNYVGGSNSPVEFDGSDTGFKGSPHLVQVGVGVNWH